MKDLAEKKSAGKEIWGERRVGKIPSWEKPRGKNLTPSEHV